MTVFYLFTFFRTDFIQSEASWKLSSTTDWLMSAWKNVSWGHPFGLLAVRWLDIGQASSRSIGSFSSDVFDCLTSTGSEPFPLLVCLNATKFVLLSVFTILETISPKVCSKSRLKSAKSPLLVDARGSKTSLLRLRRQYTAIFNELGHQRIYYMVKTRTFSRGINERHPEWARCAYLARSGSQSERRIRCILPARGFNHITLQTGIPSWL